MLRSGTRKKTCCRNKVTIRLVLYWQIFYYLHPSGFILNAISWHLIGILILLAVRHLKKYLILFTAFTTDFKSELHLLNKIQEYCYDNMNFIKSFNKIVLLLYKSKYYIYIIFLERILNLIGFENTCTGDFYDIFL